ncbi:hypothetical protein M9Y10_045581 [Tritrichomonas musculus]|uniref:DUF3447 domain-containing protein n=1 Tax=Tritrichomonas musculus TaxID=1915356 RepID=A0ABR2JYK4_9EUKA
MSVHGHIHKMKIIQQNLYDFIQDEDNKEENFEQLIDVINDKKIRLNQHDLKIFLCLIVHVSNNYRRGPNFFQKIERILQEFENDMKKFYSNYEIFKIFKNNKRILLFLLEEAVILIDNNILRKFIKNKYRDMHYIEYFLPEIKGITEKDDKILKIIQNIKIDDWEKFYKNRKKGENDDILCKIIRKDLIDDFMSFENKINGSLIKPSIFETNSFLLENKSKTSLLEYAAFFGSIKIFKYLYNKSKIINPELYPFIIHGMKEKMIHFLLEKFSSKIYKSSLEYNFDDEFYEDIIIKVPVKNIQYYKCLQESIKCHRDRISYFIQRNFIDENVHPKKIIHKTIVSTCFKYYNFLYLPVYITNFLYFKYACEYGYFTIAQLLLETRKIDINGQMIQNLCL